MCVCVSLKKYIYIYIYTHTPSYRSVAHFLFLSFYAKPLKWIQTKEKKPYPPPPPPPSKNRIYAKKQSIYSYIYRNSSLFGTNTQRLCDHKTLTHTSMRKGGGGGGGGGGKRTQNNNEKQTRTERHTKNDTLCFGKKKNV